MAKKARWRGHTVEFKQQVVERMKTGENIHKLGHELKLQRKLLYTWRYRFEERPEPRRASWGMTAEEPKNKQLRDEIAKLKSALADKTPENDFFQLALLKIQDRRDGGETADYPVAGWRGPERGGCPERAIPALTSQPSRLRCRRKRMVAAVFR